MTISSVICIPLEGESIVDKFNSSQKALSRVWLEHGIAMSICESAPFNLFPFIWGITSFKREIAPQIGIATLAIRAWFASLWITLEKEINCQLISTLGTAWCLREFSKGEVYTQTTFCKGWTIYIYFIQIVNFCSYIFMLSK